MRKGVQKMRKEVQKMRKEVQNEHFTRNNK